MTIFWIITAIVLLFGFVVAFGAPYVPSLRAEVRRAFDELYPVGSEDFVVDLGSGDGLVLHEAAKRGAGGIGYELNPLLVLMSNLRLGGKAAIKLRNMWTMDLPSQTTLVYAFTVSRDSKRLSRYVQQQADKQQRTIVIMTFGSQLPGLTPVRTLKAHSLYEIPPRSPAMQS